MTDAPPQTRDTPRIAVAIPAYGRAEAIAASITAMAKEATDEGLDVVFHVSDDTPDASVEDALAPLRANGLPVHYRRNTPPLRHDRNLVATLLWPDAEYVWLLGSGFRVAPGQFGRIARFLTGQDLLFLNVHIDDHRFIPALDGEDARALLRDALWHQTLTGATIYGIAAREWVRTQGTALRVLPNFPQLSCIMGFASERDPTIGWFGDRSLVASGSDTPSYWLDRAVDVFAHDWAKLVAAFPAIVPAEHRRRVIREHSARTQLFNTANLTRLKTVGQFRWSSLRQAGFLDAMHLPIWKLVVLLALPGRLTRFGGNALASAKRFGGRG